MDFDRRFNRSVFDACRDLADHPNCIVLTHATVTEIELDAGGRYVKRVHAQSLRRRRLAVAAEMVVLAAGRA